MEDFIFFFFDRAERMPVTPGEDLEKYVNIKELDINQNRFVDSLAHML